MTKQDEPPSTGWPHGTRVLPGLWRADFHLPLTPRLVPALYLGLCALVALAGLGGVVIAFRAATWLGVLGVVLAPVLVLGVVAVLRVLAELSLAVMRMAADVAGIAARLPRLESTISDVADDIPRFGFLKLLSGSRER